MSNICCKSVIVFSEKDNTATTIVNIIKGEKFVGKIACETIEMLDDIPMNHKFALMNINCGELIYKYGEIIGIASKDIKKGEHVHIHNVESARRKRGGKCEEN